MVQIPKFEALEDRIVLDASPDVTIDAPAEIEIGAQDVPITLTFDNGGTNDSGYAPYVDLVIPTTGSDGDDGVTFDSATFLGQPLVTNEIVFDVNGEAVHPYATDTNGDPLTILATDFGAQAGDTLIVFQLPYGSFSPGNPPVDIDVVLDFSENADINDDFTLSALGGFALGEDAQDNPGTDAPIRGTLAQTDVAQTLFEVTKTNTIPENEAATGPSYPYQYTLVVDVADGQTLDTFSLTDNLPTSLVYLGGLTIAGGTGATIVSEPPLNTQVTAGNDLLQIDFTEVEDTVTVTFDFYIAEDDGTSSVLDDNTGLGQVNNSVTGTGNWTPLDTRDARVTGLSDTATNQIEASALNIQKGVALPVDTGQPGATPGDEYVFTLDIQVADYSELNQLEIIDVLGNGWDYVEGSASFVVTEQTQNIASTGFDETASGDLDVDLSDFNAGGTTTLTFDLSQAMVTAGQDALLTGDIARDGVSDGISTVVTITYRATVRDAFTDPGGALGLPQIGQGDVLSNEVDINSEVRNPTSGVFNAITDDSQASVSIDVGSIREKTIAAINGVVPGPNPIIAAGDTVTFSIIYDSPLGSFDDLTITDNLPQLVFNATEPPPAGQPVFYAPGSGPAIPPAGQSTYGPNDTFFSSFQASGLPGTGLPTVSTNLQDNQIDYDFGGLTISPRAPVVLEILFTVTVQDALFAPDLFLTNQSTAFEGNVAVGETDTTAIAQFNYAEPELNITKGVVAFAPNPNSDVDLGDTGPVTFNAPGTSGARFSGLINSTALENDPIDANIEGIDGGDTLTFAIVVENTGRAPNGAFDVNIADSLPAGMTLVPGSVFVTDGTGATIAFTGDLFAGGITLTDPPPVGGLLEGAISGFDATAGDNIAIVTYDVTIDADAVPRETFTNTGSVGSFAATEGGINRVPAGGLSDDATAQVDRPTISKDLSFRQFTDSGEIANGGAAGRSGNEVVVGENVEFTIRIDIPEAEYFDVVISDRVTIGGLVIESAVIANSPIAGQVNTAGVVSGNEVTFNLGDFTNPSDNDLTNDFIEITVSARIDDVAGFDTGDLARNVAQFEYATQNGGSTTSIRDSANLRLAEPNLTLDKENTDADDIVAVGDRVTYEIDIANLRGSRDAPAFDLTLTDALPAAFMTLDTGSIVLEIDGTAVAFNGTDYALNTGIPANGFTIFIDRLDPNQTAIVRYEADVAQSVPAGTNIDNTADLTFDSTPEDDSGADGDDREYSLSDTETLRITSPELDKSIVSGSSSYGETADPTLGIGETITYELVATIPEGTVDGVILRDTLPAGMEYVSSTVVRFGDDPNVLNNLSAAGPIPTMGTHAGGVTTFTFGDLTNLFDGVQNAEDEIVVRVTARVVEAGVDTSQTLTNTGSLEFVDGQGVAQTVTDTAEIEVVEPDMSIAKAVSPASADAGDIVSYTVTATNDGDGPAYDMVINDDVVGALVSLNPASVALTIFDEMGGQVTTQPAGTAPLGAAAEDTFGFRVNGSGELEIVVPVLQAGYRVEIAYDAEVQDGALFSSSYTNTAEVTRYDSNPAGTEVTDPSAPEEERVYDSNLNNYTVPEATATFTTLDASLEKNYLSSSDSNTADATGATNAQLVVGETVTYELVIDIPQGTADLVLTDQLPAGLSPISAQVTAMNGATSSNGLVDNTTDANANITLTGGSAGSVEFDFGTVTLAGTTATDPAGSQIVVQVVAQVLDIVTTVEDGETLTNTATLTVQDGATQLQPPVTATESVDIVEPEVTIDKSGPIAGDPGDTVRYTIVLENTGTGPAYDGVLADPLADAFLTYGGNLTAVYNDGSTVPASDITGTPLTPSTDGFTITGIDLLPGETLTVSFDVFIETNAPEANTFVNTAQFQFDTVEDGTTTTPGARTDTVSDNHQIATIPFIFKEPFDSSNADTNSDSPTDTPFDLAVGEEVTYRYLITLPELSGQTMSITDDLPSGFRFVEAEVDLTGSLLSGANLSSASGLTVGVNAGGPTISLAGNDVTFDFGAVDNPVNGVINAGDSFYLLVTAVVEDNAANVAGADRTNTVTLDVDPDGPGGLGPFNQQQSSADVRIVEPLIEIDKTGPLALSPGQSGQFTITATNSGPNVTPSATGPAYDIEIGDTLPAGMTLDATAFTVLIDGVTTAFTETRTAGNDGFTITVPRLLPDQVLTVQYNATLDAGVAALTTYTNTATADYDSAPGDPVDSQGNPITDRDAPQVSDTHTIATLPTLDKTVTGTSNPLTGDAQFDAFDDLAIGEEATYQLVITLPDIPMDSVQLVDALPPGMDFVSAQVISTDADITINGTTSITDAGQNVTFLFTDVVNAVGGTNQITVEVVARVNALASNVDDADLTNTGTLTIAPQGEAALTPVTDTATVEVVEPELTIDKTGNIAVNPGDTIDYNIRIENTGNAPAYDLIIADPMTDPFLSLNSGTVVVTLNGTNITADLNIVESAGGFSVELDDINNGGVPFAVPVGAVVEVTYQATLASNAPDAESFPNTASVNYDTLPGDPVDSNGNPIPDRDYSADDTHLVATVPFLTKEPTASSFAETGANNTELNIGEEVTFTYEIYLPEVALERIFFFDDLPDGLDYVGFNVVSTGDITASSGGPVPAPTETVTGNDVELVWTNLDNPLNPTPLGSIGTDDIITVQVVARVTDQFTAGTDLVNNALIEADPVGAPPLNQATATSTVSIVEPELSVSKTGPQGANPGDTIPYQIVVENSHPSGSTGPAYDVSIVDTIPAGITLDPSTLTFTSNQRGVLTPTSLTANGSGFDADFAFLQADEILTITYDATLSASASTAQTFRNEVDVNYDSAPGNDPNQKVYTEVSDDHRIGTIPALEKTILSTNIPQTGSAAHDPAIQDVNVGELITYQLTLTISELDDQLVVLTDTLPAGLEFVSSEVTAVGAEITSGVTLGDTSAGVASGQLVTFTFTDVDNTYAVGLADEGVIDAEDQVVINVVTRVADVAAATDGAQLTNDARLNVRTSDGFNFTEQQDDVTVEVVEPQIDIVKSVSIAEPMVGDTITYTVTLSNDASATGPAFNLVITDALPTDLSLTGAPRLSDPSLATVLSGSGATLVVSAPVLLPGQSVTVEYDVFVGFLTPVLQGVENTATVVGSTTPFGPGRALTDQDSALITSDPVPTSVVDEDGSRFAFSGIDDAQFLPILLIDPIFSGTAEPGSNVTVSLYRQDGSMSYVRNIVADAGGHWIALFPRVELEQVEDDFWSFYDRSSLFDAPTKPLDNIQRTSFGTPVPDRALTIGTLLNDEGYSIQLQQDRPSTLPEASAMHNARTFFNPATVGEGFGTGVVLKVDEVFDDVAGLTVEQLYQSSVDPLGTSLNRFNYEFLSEATALPGSAR